MTAPSERRRVQRVKLLEPLPGRIDAQLIFILDVSRTGLRVAHQESLGARGDHRLVDFEWDGRRISLECRLTHSHVQRVGKASYARSIYHSGLLIVAASPGSPEVLREMIEWHVSRALHEQKASAPGVPQYVRHVFAAGAWRDLRTFEAEQPANGFTIPAAQSAAEVAMLRAAWEAGDEPARSMIRKMAERSISRADGIPTRRDGP